MTPLAALAQFDAFSLGAANPVNKLFDAFGCLGSTVKKALGNTIKNMLKNAITGDGEVVSSTTEISNVTNVIIPPVMPVKEDYPRTKQGRRNFRNAYKQYVIEMKEYNKTQQNLVKPSESNKNGLTALNKTDGLTSMNGSGSTTIVYQRQVVQVPVATPIKV